ncbi:hypothetical protein [Planomonospora algeriensis]
MPAPALRFRGKAPGSRTRRNARAPAGTRAVRRLVWRDRHSGREVYAPVATGPDGGFTVRQAAGRLTAGTWDAYLELDLGGPPVRFRVEAAAELIAPARTWWRGTVRRTAKPYGTAGKGRLSVVVRAVPLHTLLRRMLR